ncbi:MAG: ABC transporter permease [Bacillota bacterium]|jgi:ABC-2 type transport system permease protein
MRAILNQIRYILSSRWRIVLFFVVPLLVTVYLGLLFQQGIIEHTRIIVVDQDQSSLSRSLTQEFHDNPGFNVVQTMDSVQEAISLVKQEKADMILNVPYGFSRDIKKGQGASVLMANNAANMAISSNAQKRASEIILTFNAGVEIQRLQGKGLMPVEAENIALPLKYYYRQVGNPSGSFYDFLLWGLIGAIGHFPIIMLSAVFLDKKKRYSLKEIFVGVTAYTLLGVLEILLCILLAVLFFPLTFKGSLINLILLVLIFVLAVVSIGTFLSVMMPNPVMASQGAVIVALPALLLSGHTWPMSGFPWFIRVLGFIEPLTYFVDPLRDLGLRGQTTAFYWKGIAVLFLMAVFYNTISLLICWYRRKVAL